MKIRTIERKDISILLPLFDKVYPGADLNDELDYFDEMNPHDWLLIENNNQVVGYARNFPDSDNNFAPVEYFVKDEYKNKESTTLLLENFCQGIPKGLNPRFQVKATDTLDVKIIEQYFPYTVHYCYYEILAKDIKSINIERTALATEDQAKSIQEILFPLGNYSPTTLKELIARNLIYSYVVTGEVVGACYIHFYKDLEMEMLAIRKDQQSKGHGKTFLKELFYCFKIRQANRVFLKVKSTDFGIISLYKKCGMKHIHEKDEFWFSRTKI